MIRLNFLKNPISKVWITRFSLGEDADAILSFNLHGNCKLSNFATEIEPCNSVSRDRILQNANCKHSKILHAVLSEKERIKDGSIN